MRRPAMKRRCPRRVHEVKLAHYVAPYGGRARLSTSKKSGQWCELFDALRPFYGPLRRRNIRLILPLESAEETGASLQAHEQNLIDLLRREHSWDEMQLLLEPQPERHQYPVVPPHGPLTMMRKPPHSGVDEKRGARLHAKYGAARNDELVLRQLC